MIKEKRILAIQIANGLSSEARVMSTLLAQSGPGNHILVVLQNPLHDEELSRAFRVESSVYEMSVDLGWRPSLGRKRRLVERIAPLVRFTATIPRVLWTARKFRPDIIISNQQRWDSSVARFLGLVLGRPVVLHLHYNVGPWLGRTGLSNIRSASLILTVSEFIRRQVLELGVPPDKVVKILNSVGLPFGLDPSERENLRSHWLADPTDGIIVTMVSRIDPYKSHADVIRAIERLPALARKRVSLLFAGGGTIEDEMRTLADAAGIGDQAHFLGVRRDVPQLLAASDIFIHPSIDDPCPLAVLEAAAAGLPIVAYRSGGIPEIVVDGETASLVDVGDIDGLSEKLLELVEDSQMRHQYGRRASQRILKGFRPIDAGRLFREALDLVMASND